MLRRSQPVLIGGAYSRAQKNFGYVKHGSEARIFGQAMMIPVKNLLNDYGGLEQGKDIVKNDIADVTPGFFRIALHELNAGQASRPRSWPPMHRLQFGWIARFHPVTNCSAQIRQRIADSAHFPIQYA